MDSNPQPLALQAGALATKLRRHRMTARFEKRDILMKSRNSILGRSLHSEFSPVIYVTEYRSKSLKKTARPLLSMTPHIYIRPETDYDLPTSCEPVK